VSLSRGDRRPHTSVGKLAALDGAFCQEMLNESLSRGTPEVFNTDQGVQFTARALTPADWRARA
jgi:hypothetical protein